MGSKSGGGNYQQVPSFSTQTTIPNGEAGAAYSDLLRRAQSAANTPYEAYRGQLVADFTPDQWQAFNQVRGLQGYTDPYMDAATAATTGALDSMSPENYGRTIDQYYNPYQQRVVDTTLATINNQNAQQLNDLQSKAIMSGGMGGDRAGVSRAALQGQQNLSRDQTVAQLQAQGYTNAQAQAMAGANLGLTGGAQLANLGLQGLQGALTSTGALSNAGQMQQAQTQRGLDTAYQQWQLMKQFPYAQSQWLAGMLQGVGPLMGSTTSGFQTTPVQQPSQSGQIMGGLLSGLGLIGSLFADGGRVPAADGGRVGLDMGGVPQWNSAAMPMATPQPSASTQLPTAANPILTTNSAGIATPAPGAGVGMPIPQEANPIFTTGGNMAPPAAPGFTMPDPHGAGFQPPTPATAPAPAAQPAPWRSPYGSGRLASFFNRPRGFGYGAPWARPPQAMPGGNMYPGGGVKAMAPPMDAGMPGGNMAPGGLWMADGGRVAMAEGGEMLGGGLYGLPVGNLSAGHLDAPSLHFASPHQPQGGGGINPEALGKSLGDIKKKGVGLYDKYFAKPEFPATPQTGEVPLPPRRPADLGAAPETGDWGLGKIGDFFSGLGFADGGRVHFLTGGAGDGPDGADDADGTDKYLAALAMNETGGRDDPYSVVGPRSRHGDYPYGKYQVMGANIPTWTREAGLKEMTPEEFLASRDAQEAVAKHRFGQYVQQTGSPMAAAAMWLGGPGWRKHAGATDVLGTSAPEYMRRFQSNLAKVGGAPLAYAANDGGASDAINDIRSGRGGITVDDIRKLMDERTELPDMAPEPEGKHLIPPAVSNALMAAGFGMMASGAPTLGQAIGRGGLAGLSAFAQSQDALREDAASRQSAMLRRMQMQRLLDQTRKDKVAQMIQLYTAQNKTPAAGQTDHVGVIGEDQFGQKQYGYVSGPRAGQPLAGGAAPAGSAGQPDASNIDFNKTGEEFLKQIPPAEQNKVKAIVEGRAKMPSGMGANNPNARRLYSFVTAYDPTFDVGNADARIQLRKQFASTKANDAGGQITAGNVAIRHLGELSDAAEQLGNWRLTPINAVKNALAQPGGGAIPLKIYQNALGRFAEEATKFYRGVGGTEADIKRAMEDLNPNQSPEQLRAGIRTQAALMADKISALEDQWKQVMGEKASLPVAKYEILRGDSHKALANIERRFALKDAPEGAAPKEEPKVLTPAGGSEKAPPVVEGGAKTAINPKTGERIILRNGKWEPL